jgi:hypothetical protein
MEEILERGILQREIEILRERYVRHSSDESEKARERERVWSREILERVREKNGDS